jgi:hypothetical protein
LTSTSTVVRFGGSPIERDFDPPCSLTGAAAGTGDYQIK